MFILGNRIRLLHSCIHQLVLFNPSQLQNRSLSLSPFGKTRFAMKKYKLEDLPPLPTEKQPEQVLQNPYAIPEAPNQTSTIDPQEADDFLLKSRLPVETGPKRDIRQRQAFIDQLILELDKKTHALEIVGTECMNLRRTIKTQSSEIESLQDKMQTLEFDTKRLVNCYDIDILTPDELRYKYVRLARKLEGCLEWIKQAEPITKQHELLTQEHYNLRMSNHKLQQAHNQQQLLLLSLQEQGNQQEKFRGVIMKQEVVIRELEGRMEKVFGRNNKEEEEKSRGDAAKKTRKTKSKRTEPTLNTALKSITGSGIQSEASTNTTESVKQPDLQSRLMQPDQNVTQY